MPLNYQRALQRSESSFDLAGVQYRVEKELGSGQSGKATLFTSAHQSKKVVKKPHYHSRNLADAQKERVYYQLAYPNLSVDIDEGRDGDYRLVLPYLGIELLEHLKLLSYSEIIGVLQQVINELERLHGLGITHYDVQLRNILISQGGRVFFIDGITHKAPSNKRTQIHDLRALASCIAAALQPYQMISLEAFRACQSFQELRQCLRNPLGTAVASSYMGAPVMLFQPQKRLTLKINQALMAANKSFDKSPLKQLAIQVLTEVKKAYLEEGLSEKNAIAYINRTADLVSSPDTHREQYAAEACALSSSSSRYARNIGKAMLVLAVATVVVAAVCFPTSLGPVLAGVFVFSAIGAALAYCLRKTAVEGAMESLANTSKPTIIERLSGRVGMCFN